MPNSTEKRVKVRKRRSTTEDKSGFEQANAIAEAVANELEKRHTTNLTHQDHHQWISIKIERERKRAVLFETVKASVLGGVILMAISALAAVGWYVIKLVKNQ